MKKNTMMMFALVAMTAGLTVNADETPESSLPPVPPVLAAKMHVALATLAQKAPEVTTTKLSAEEVAFAAKLNDQNRKTFSEKFSAEQRGAVMVAGKNGANADEAVQGLVASKEIKDASVISSAEKAAPAAH